MTGNALSDFTSYSMLQLVATGFGSPVVAADGKVLYRVLKDAAIIQVIARVFGAGRRRIQEKN
jgi:hypothetical protein